MEDTLPMKEKISIGDLIYEKISSNREILGIITKIDDYLDIEIFWLDLGEVFYYNVDDFREDFRKVKISSSKTNIWEFISKH
ncbi:hypothetical protein OAT10_00080 [Luminiphilus sp.]|nr:hypothetical protein [Luminiphilus sp.]